MVDARQNSERAQVSRDQDTVNVAHARMIHFGHRGGPLTAHLFEPTLAVQAYGLHDVHSLTILQLLYGHNDEPGHHLRYRDEDPLPVFLLRLKELEALSRGTRPLDVLIAVCEDRATLQPQVLANFFQPFIGAARSRARAYMTEVLNAYKRFQDEGPERGFTGLHLLRLAGPKLPFPDLEPLAAAVRLRELVP